jgi:hypothetical protein
MKYIGMCGHPRFKEERGASSWCTLIKKKNSPFQRSIQLIFQKQNKQHAMHLWDHLIKGNLQQKGSNIKSKRKSDPEERVEEWNYRAGRALLALNEGSSVLHKWMMFFQARHFLQSLSILQLLCKLDASGITDDCWQVYICYNHPILRLYLVDLVDPVFSHNSTFQMSLPDAPSWVISLCNLSHLCMCMGSGQFPDPCCPYHFHTVWPVDIVGTSYITMHKQAFSDLQLHHP